MGLSVKLFLVVVFVLLVQYSLIHSIKNEKSRLYKNWMRMLKFAFVVWLVIGVVDLFVIIALLAEGIF